MEAFDWLRPGWPSSAGMACSPSSPLYKATLPSGDLPSSLSIWLIGTVMASIWDSAASVLSPGYLGVAVFALAYLGLIFRAKNLRHIPTVGGPSLPILSYLGVYSYYFRHKEIIQQGYQKYKGGAFKCASLDQWVVIVTGKQLVDELARFPEDKASFVHGMHEVTGMFHVFGMDVWEYSYPVDIIRSVLTRHIAPFFGDIHNEVEASFRDLVPTRGDEWVPVLAFDAMREVVARISGRVFVGLPTSRDPEYLDIAMNLTMDFAKIRKYLAILPAGFKRFFARRVSSIDSRLSQAKRVLEPLIEERISKFKEYGKDGYPDMPDDLLMWYIEEAVQHNQDTEVIVRTVLLIIFASIHTSSNIFTHALYYIAANPELAAPLREEAERAIAAEGWSKAAMGKMRKMDSLFRECMRHHGIHTSSLNRKAIQPLGLADGTYIPRGTLISIATISLHHDEELHDNPWTFDSWRFETLRDEDKTILKHQLVTTSTDYVAFGHGKHACPGRFFAANELKAMMAHLVLNYDVAFAQEGVRPTDSFGIMAISPDPVASVLFRKRQTT